jgi:hypothetical protein
MKGTGCKGRSVVRDGDLIKCGPWPRTLRISLRVPIYDADARYVVVCMTNASD